MERTAPEITLIAQPDDPLPLGKAALLGLQHVLAMDVYIVPFIIASVLAFSAGDAGAFIQSAFVAAGIATLIQSQLLMRLPVVQGPSFVPIGAVLAIAFGAGGGIAGLSAVIGALIPGAILVMLLGSPTGIFHRLVDRFVPPIVGGAIIIVVGIALMPVALRESVFAVHGTATVGGNIILAFVAAAVLVGCMLTGMALGAKGAWLRLLSVIIALVAGCVAAASMSQLNMGAVSEATWFSMPRVAFLNLDVTFSLSATLTMLIVYIVVLAETTGTWFAVGAVIDKPLSNEQLDRGATGEGLGCLVSALLCSTPVTGYSSNAGIIAITGIASRAAFAAAGIFLVLFGLVGKLSAVIASIPGPVIGGVFGVLCVVIAMNGFRVVRGTPLTERNMLVVGLPILMALFATLAPPDFVKTLPDIVQYILGSSIAFGAVWAIVLHQILPSAR
ncbi:MULTISPECIES: solute carrier family 23 protein [unclassified Mesorhizobium]|uniref:uracil-xanthine permease family protein n=1 Tax=unclassified Mesorhizobium TaxID=325217 RepID=UPI00112EF165|nr:MULTISPECIES: solute carrier family 23 protein [unclassified Mesorhizobium]MBZ9958917.1 purine/pyrimidine permease [Mesorhizobium sp. BR1-1-14]TPL33073.1 purine permease [Mesorhizobium sp. B2-4-8]TPL65458.1 purine permease [Mesorhizobium sp. B2-4-1]